MESRIKGRVLSIIVAGAMIASTSTSVAATTKPTPKPSAKTTVKATAKPSPKPSAKVSVKATPKPTPKPSAKSTPKATKKPVKKKPVIKKPSPKKIVYKRKAVKVTPSPSPKWPPDKTYANPSSGEIYYKIPNGKELLGELSAAAALSEQVKACAKFACGVVKVASTNGCTWWSIDSVVYGPLSATDSTPVPYGNLHTTARGTNKKQVITIIMMSTEPLKPNMSVGKLGINCYHTPSASAPDKIPSNVYAPSAPTPSPTDSATPTNTN